MLYETEHLINVFVDFDLNTLGLKKRHWYCTL